METLFRDIRFGIRHLVKSPGFAAIALLSLALGIGANTAIFSLVNTVLLRPFPVERPEQIVSLTVETKDGCRSINRFGPYATREAAEHALATVAERNEQFDREDAEWNGTDSKE